MSKDVKAFPVNYWDALTAEEVAEFSTLKNGLHANLAETSAVLAINPDLVDMEKANAEFPPFPDYGTVTDRPGAHRVFLHGAGVGLLGDEVRHVGRRARVHAGDRRALSAGRRALDAARAREHREDVQRRCRRGSAAEALPTDSSKPRITRKDTDRTLQSMWSREPVLRPSGSIP